MAKLPKRDKTSAGESRFPVVGIGASAGGLEALEGFLRHVPRASGMAYVVVQHLDPTQDCLLVELLQRSTVMPVQWGRDGVKLEPDQVYVVPPKTDPSMLHGQLYLLETGARGPRLPIDFFFRSLAEDCRELAIGVILSGMGSDGTLGLRAIKEKAGVAFVQDPALAKFDSMPRSAIEAQLADVVAPAEQIPERILAYVRHGPLIRPRAGVERGLRSDLDKILLLIRLHTGHDFSLYKQTTLRRRLERRMGIHKVDSPGAYVRFLQGNPQEADMLYHELLIGVTSFFRDFEAWQQLKDQIVSAFLEAGSFAGSTTLLAWSVGCSTGEEAYSLAMMFKEAQEQAPTCQNVSLQIFATDLDAGAIEKARAGVFPCNIAADVSQRRLTRFFVKEGDSYRICREIRDMVTFAPQNLVMDPPFTKLDLIICRNLLIYLTPDLQRRVLSLFHYCLNPRGILFLGSAETAGSQTELFAPLEGKMRLYRRLESARRSNLPAFPLTSGPAPTFNGEQGGSAESAKPYLPNLQQVAEQIVLQSFAPAALLTNNCGDILYIIGRTGKYLEPAAGKVNWNLLAMARPSLRAELTQAFHRALKEGQNVEVKGARVEVDGGLQVVNVVVRPLNMPEEGMQGLAMVAFFDVEVRRRSRRGGSATVRSDQAVHIANLEVELRRARDDLQALREERQTSEEELRSSNEELQSSNEELQSTNEELTTSKEEMQSLNEELHSLNQELGAKVLELSAASNDIKNLLDSTEIATLFLDEELRLRRFTPLATRVIQLIPGDVGRPITDLTTRLDYASLAEDALEVLRTLVFIEKQVPTARGIWYNVRIMPYRTLDNRIDGLVITFVETTSSKLQEAALQESDSRFCLLFENIHQGAILCEASGVVAMANARARELVGRPLRTSESLLGPAWKWVARSGSTVPPSQHPLSLARAGRAAAHIGLQSLSSQQIHWFRMEAVPSTGGGVVLVLLTEESGGDV